MIDSIPGTGDPYIATYNWEDVPDIDEQVRIRIRDGNGVTGISGTFSLVSPAKPTRLEINHSSYPVPKDREVLIEWDMNHDGEVIELWYSQGIGSVPITPEPLPGSARTYIWHTPPFDLPEVTLGIRVDGGNGISIGPFAIGEAAGVEQISQGQFSFAPNPASSSVVVAGLPAGTQKIVILDVLGRPVVSFPTGSPRIDVSALPAGSYKLTCQTQSETFFLPLIISR